MNITENNTIKMTLSEWNQVGRHEQERIRSMCISKGYDYSTDTWTFKFAGITDKQSATELCGYFGLKVTV